MKTNKNSITIRDFLFKGFDGCSNGYCIITGPNRGQHTNASCTCLRRLSHGQLCILQSRINHIADYKIDLG